MVANRLQNVVITLDKVKMVLRAPNQVGAGPEWTAVCTAGKAVEF